MVRYELAGCHVRYTGTSTTFMIGKSRIYLVSESVPLNSEGHGLTAEDPPRVPSFYSGLLTAVECDAGTRAGNLG